MELRSLAATFGRLDNETLTLKPGLNIIEAANECGKSTWMAFLRVMLYGLSTRDRSAGADKRRYLPWNGRAMQGRVDLIHRGTPVTINRTTARASSPMGEFTAVYTDTATSVPDLTAADCGEMLIGAPQEVFERSAFIRQAGIPFDHNATLERRIASLITTGEEDTAYSDAADRLRRQLNRRRHNKTGLLPHLEAEMHSLEASLSELSALQSHIRTLEDDRDRLLLQEADLRRELALCAAAENARRIAQFHEAQAALEAAGNALAAAEARTAALPSREVLSRMIGELSAVETMGDAVRAAEKRIEERTADLSAAEHTLSSHPFAPRTPEDAAAAFHPDRCPRLPRWMYLLPITLGALPPVLHSAFSLTLPLCIGAAAILALSCLAALLLTDTGRKKRWKEACAQKRTEHLAAVDTYTELYEKAEQCRAELEAARGSRRTLDEEYHSHLDQILSRIQHFDTANTVCEARTAIERAQTLHGASDAARQQLAQARLRRDLLSENLPDGTDIPSERPTLTQEQAENRLRAVTEHLGELSRSLHNTEGRKEALGDPLLLQAELEEARRRHASLSAEYRAIELASRVLEVANTELQNRFSPALGEKTASIFTKLSKGKYNRVLLDKDLIPSAQETGDMVSREAALLSRGAADQLYLAVRLAVCEMVLSPDVPILLDDALVNFDDERMAAALDCLVELSATRQILLFTCQHRELRYLSSAHSGRFHAVTRS